jgi:hypothetical protein
MRETVYGPMRPMCEAPQADGGKVLGWVGYEFVILERYTDIAGCVYWLDAKGDYREAFGWWPLPSEAGLPR